MEFRTTIPEQFYGIDGGPIEFEWNILRRRTSLELLRKFQEDLQRRNIDLEKFEDRLIFTPMSATCSRMTDFEIPAWGKRKQEEAPQGQGRRAVRQAVAEGGNEREILRRMVDVLATLSLVKA